MVHQVQKMKNIIHMAQYEKYESIGHGSTPQEHSFSVAQLYYFKQITRGYWLGNFAHVVTGKLRGPVKPQGVRMNTQNQMNQCESPGRDHPPHELSSTSDQFH